MSKLPTKKWISDFKIAAFVFRVGTTFTGIFCFCFLLNICETFKVPCPSEWILNEFSGKCLRLYHEQLPWQDAREKCKSNNGDLIRITDSKMNEFVHDLIKSHSSPFWIGLSKKGDQFYWLDENRNASYVNWHSSTRSQETSVCAAMGSTEGKWVDMICDDHHKFVCEKGEGVCSPGWIPSFPSGSCIKMSSTRKTWKDSRKACKVDGGDLVKIADEAMNDFIWEQMSWLKGNTHWIGANDLKVKDKYVWLDESEELYFKGWGFEQPNFHLQHCVDINHPGFNKGWTDYWCNQTALFICEKIAVCPEGSYGKRCDNECSRNCAESRTCNATTGECTHGCISGYQPKKCDSECTKGTYGKGCANKCSGNCANSSRCDAVTGYCPSGCAPGYQGKKCDTKCPNGWYGKECANECSGNCRENERCSNVNGYCPRGCIAGYQGNKCNFGCTDEWYGRDCIQQCSVNCAESKICNPVTGHCLSGCVSGYQGDKCDTECSNGMYGKNCANECSGNCANSTRCNSTTGYCPSGCVSGYEGKRCDTQTACKKGWYGIGCTNECSGNCKESKTCNYLTGECTSGCVSGYRGNRCDTECSNGTYGKDCANECSGNCAESKTCNTVTGGCPSGCVSGYQGDKCDTECPKGLYGKRCAIKCSGNCAESKTCNPVTGDCPSGCVSGYQGNKCATECGPLRYGPNCVKECSPNCAGTGACNASTGSCTDGGCVPGYKGGTCDEVVQVGKLEAGGGTVLPIALAGLCLIPLACLVVLFVRRKRKQKPEAEVDGPNKSTSVASFKGDIKVQENVPVEENADTTKDTEVAVGPNPSVVFNGPTTGSTTSGAAGLVEESLLQQPSKLSLGRVHSLAPIKSTILPSESSNQ